MANKLELDGIMVDHAIKYTLKQKIEDGDFGSEDIPDYLQLFCQMGNDLAEIAELIEDWNLSIELDLVGLGQFWLFIVSGQIRLVDNPIESPDLILGMDSADAAMIFSGQKDAQAAFMAGELQIKGQLPDALKFRSLVEAVSEEIEY